MPRGQRGDRLYLHLFAWPLDDVNLAGLAGTLTLTLPVVRPDVVVPVVELFLKESAATAAPR